jgi:hypothetical protein
MRKKTVVVLFVMLIVPGFLFAQKSGTKKSTTAQSIQLSFDSSKTNIVGADGEWDFLWGDDDGEEAAGLAAWSTYFTGQVTAGEPNEEQINSAKLKAMRDNKKNFFCGNALQVAVNSGSKQFTSTPISNEAVAAKTGWIVDAEADPSEGSIEFTDIFIAAQSFVMNDKKQEKWTQKYSFDLGGTTEYTRVENVTFTLLREEIDVDTEEIVHVPVAGQVKTPQHEIVNFETWNYQKTMQFGTAIDKLQVGDVAEILKGSIGGGIGGDDFAGNDYAGGDKAIFDDVTFEITEAGAYWVRIDGIIKGNELLQSQGFSILASGGKVEGAPKCD